jgi:spermidine synthase
MAYDMTFEFEELDYQTTPLGEISLRRRSEPRLKGAIVYEVKLGDEFLMSSLFTEAEAQLAKLALATVADDREDSLDVIVGGLGLGYTAAAALENLRVRSLVVIEVMQPVIDWHRRGLVPLGERLCADSRCQLLRADFFALAMSDQGFFAGQPSRTVDAVLLDIDHSPSHWLNPGNSAFYTTTGLQYLAARLKPGGVFGLWSDDLPDAAFTRMLENVFGSCISHIVTFPNPYTGGESSNTVYLARNTTGSVR